MTNQNQQDTALNNNPVELMRLLAEKLGLAQYITIEDATDMNYDDAVKEIQNLIYKKAKNRRNLLDLFDMVEEHVDIDAVDLFRYSRSKSKSHNFYDILKDMYMDPDRILADALDDYIPAIDSHTLIEMAAKHFGLNSEMICEEAFEASRGSDMIKITNLLYKEAKSMRGLSDLFDLLEKHVDIDAVDLFRYSRTKSKSHNSYDILKDMDIDPNVILADALDDYIPATDSDTLIEMATKHFGLNSEMICKEAFEVSRGSDMVRIAEELYIDIPPAVRTALG